MNTVVALQFAYALTGSLYNFFSIARLKSGQTPLSATNPFKGVVIMAAVAGVTLTQPYLNGIPYTIGWLFGFDEDDKELKTGIYMIFGNIKFSSNSK